MILHRIHPQRQQRGEVARHLEVHGQDIWVVRVTPDRVRTVDILTAAEALEWADELRDAAGDVTGRVGR